MQFCPVEELLTMFKHKVGIWRLSLEQIEATVADHLGRGRVQGNQPGPCFSRQVSMYLAKNVGGWSTTRIGRFYNGRHHTTVLHAIGKIERLRRDDESVRRVDRGAEGGCSVLRWKVISVSGLNQDGAAD